MPCSKSTLHLLACLTVILVLIPVSAEEPASPAPPGTDLAGVLVDAIALTGPPPLPPTGLIVRSGDQIAFMGDSITSTNVNRGGYLRLIQYVLGQNYPGLKLIFINAGIGGHRADMMAPRFVKDTKLGQGTTLIFINAGVNDVGQRRDEALEPTNLELYRDSLIKMVEEAQGAKVPVILVTPTVIYESTEAEQNKRLQVYADAMKQIAEEKNCGLVDWHAMFMTAIANKPPGMRLTCDGVHMGLYGDTILALGILRALGVPDATSAATDLTPTLRLNLWPTPMPLLQAAELLQVPLNRFARPEWHGVLTY